VSVCRCFGHVLIDTFFLHFFLHRQGDYKLLIGLPGIYSGWYLPNRTYEEEARVGAKLVQALNEAAKPGSENAETLLHEALGLQGWDNEPHLYNVKGMKHTF
jgi:hypothetical protein